MATIRESASAAEQHAIHSKHEDRSPASEHGGDQFGGPVGGVFGESPDRDAKLVSNRALLLSVNSKVRGTALRHVQRSHGNQFVQRALNQPHGNTAGTIQRQCACGSSCEKCRTGLTASEERAPVQRFVSSRSSDSAGGPDNFEHTRADLANSSGEPMAPHPRQFMESRLGRDFKDVRIHTDNSAANSAEALHANAFTTGRDIYFARSRYAPESVEGRRLLAHELTHSIQQSQSYSVSNLSNPATDLQIDPDERLEREADQVANNQDWTTNDQRTATPFASVPIFEAQSKPHVARDPNNDINAPGAAVQQTPWGISTKIETPDLIWVPGDASPQLVAENLFGDPTRISAFEFAITPSSDDIAGAPIRAVRVRDFQHLEEGALFALRWALDRALKRDVDWTVSKLSERRIDGGDELALARTCLDWSQRSDIPSSAGSNYFDAYLDALNQITLTQGDWYSLTVTETSHSALRWLLIETEERAEMIKKAIELRSTAYRGFTGYTPTQTSSELGTQADAVYVGRFFWSTGSSIQIFVTSELTSSPQREEAIRETKLQRFGSHSRGSGLGMAVVIPDERGVYHGYSVVFRTMDPLQPDPLDDPAGQFIWYYPGTIFLSEHYLWAEATRQQRQQAVASQEPTLETAIASNEQLLDQVRVSLLTRPDPNLRLPHGLAEKWAEARLSLELIRAELTKQTPDPTILSIPRSKLSSFNWALFATAQEDEISAKELEDQTRATAEALRPSHRPCPSQGRCHDLNASEPTYFQAPKPVSPLIQPVLVRLNAAVTNEEWTKVLEDFVFVTGLLDNMILSRVPENDEQKQGFIYTRDLLKRQRALFEENPNYVRLPAVFYPQESFTIEKTPEGEAHAVAKGIPWELYLTHTGVQDPFQTPRANIEWVLKDITSPDQTHEYRIPASDWEGVRLQQGERVDPPMELFNKLNNRLLFPKGRLFWTMPSGKEAHLETTEPKTLSDWLKDIGIALAALSLMFASAGAGTPAAVALLLSVGFSIAGTVAGMQEKADVGMLTDDDVTRAMLSIAADLATAFTAGLGRIASVSARITTVGGASVNLSRLSVAAGRWWFVAQRTAIGLDVINLAIATNDLIIQYRLIQNNQSLSAGERDAALRKLIYTGLITGALAIHSLRSNIADLRLGSTLNIDMDELGNPIVRQIGATGGRDIPIETGPIHLNAPADPSSLSTGSLDAPKPGAQTVTPASGASAPGPGRPPVTSAAPDPYRNLSPRQLRERAKTDPEAAEALRLRFRAMPDDELRPYVRRGDAMAKSIYESRIPINKELESLARGHGQFSDAQAYERLLPRVTALRGEAGAVRQTPSFITPDIPATMGGTVGAAITNTPGLETRVFAGGSPEAGWSRNPASQFAPPTAYQTLPQTHGHAEQHIADGLDGALQAIPIDQRRGRTVWMLVEARACSTCFQGLENPDLQAGVLRRLSERYPEMVFEVKNLEDNSLLRFENGRLTNRQPPRVPEPPPPPLPPSTTTPENE